MDGLEAWPIIRAQAAIPIIYLTGVPLRGDPLAGPGSRSRNQSMTQTLQQTIQLALASQGPAGPGAPHATEGCGRQDGTPLGAARGHVRRARGGPLAIRHRRTSSPQWPLRTTSRASARHHGFEHAWRCRRRPGGEGVTNSIVARGCRLQGGRVERAILSPDVWIEAEAEVQESILFDGGAHWPGCTGAPCNSRPRDSGAARGSYRL